MELSTTTRGKAKLLWNGYTKHTEKNDMIRWHCTCHASKLCPASAYTDLLPAYPMLKIDHNHCPEPMKLEVIFFKEICLYRIFIGFTTNIVCPAPFLKTRRRQRFCGSWPSIYGEKHPIRSNVLRTGVLLRSSRILQHCVYNGDSIDARNRTRDFKAGSACWVVRPRSDNRKRRIMDASMKPMISVKLSTLELFY